MHISGSWIGKRGRLVRRWTDEAAIYGHAERAPFLSDVIACVCLLSIKLRKRFGM
jgi:hypothetical protein